MNESMQIISEYLAIWAPSLISILSILGALIPAMRANKDQLKSMKNDKTFAELSDKLDRLSAENRELVRCNKLLLDKITKINDYADLKKKEGRTYDENI